MRILVFLVCVNICTGTTTPMDPKMKQPIQSPKVKTISMHPQKSMMYLQHAQLIPVQIVHRPVYPFGNQPHAVMIIAQPALVPQHLLYSSQPQGTSYAQQQLLNYFHSNPAAKYQLLYGLQQQVPVHPSGNAPYQVVTSNHLPTQSHPTAQHTQLTPVSPPSSSSSPSSSSNYLSQPSPMHDSANTQNSPQYSSHPQVFQLSQLASYASLGAQHYNQGGQYSQEAPQYTNSAPPQSQYQLPIRSVPPIITGFENFTPEQQAQIKAQLGAHLSGQVTTPLSSTVLQPGQSQEYDSQEDKGGVQGEDSKFSPIVSYKPQYNTQYKG